jgi:hypothetical protein
MRQRLSSASWTHLTPAGFPSGIPGIGDEMDGAVQQAPQPGRQLSASSLLIMVEYLDGGRQYTLFKFLFLRNRNIIRA